MQLACLDLAVFVLFLLLGLLKLVEGECGLRHAVRKQAEGFEGFVPRYVGNGSEVLVVYPYVFLAAAKERRYDVVEACV